ncbi:hypothetical protein CWR61_02580 [Bordetella bronchiseptica]|nr:hypothetical protein CWR61_02580 [Bordetella bronchiseptica]
MDEAARILKAEYAELLRVRGDGAGVFGLVAGADVAGPASAWAGGGGYSLPLALGAEMARPDAPVAGVRARETGAHTGCSYREHPASVSRVSDPTMAAHRWVRCQASETEG